jgi:ABC-type sugar transport system ATPase subunit
LDGIDFELKAGEVHAVCGENGAGKSTLMKVICGVYPPDSGGIFLYGNKEDFKSPMDVYEKGVAIIFQETSLFEEMTILENVFLAHEITTKAGKIFTVLDYPAMRKKITEIFERLNTRLDIDSRIRDLGMAQKQMVEIAKALTFNARILILDEPTASLTQKEVDALFAIIRNLRQEGLGIVYISHRLEEIFDICDRVTVLRDGRRISTKAVKDTNKDELVADMAGHVLNAGALAADRKIGEKILCVDHLYDEERLTDINFYVKKGEIVGFAGLSGAGRSELMQTLCGFRKIRSGTITLEGKQLSFRNYNDAKKNGIAYVSEDRGKFGVILKMSITQNITLPQLSSVSVGGILSPGKERKMSNKYLEELNIKAPNTDFLVENLSGGNQQKVSLSRALALKPKILILDEPTRGVDVNAKMEIHKIISLLTRNDLTILLVSSELPELLDICDRIYVLKDGRIRTCFDRENATQKKILKVALEAV